MSNQEMANLKEGVMAENQLNRKNGNVANHPAHHVYGMLTTKRCESGKPPKKQPPRMPYQKATNQKSRQNSACLKTS